MWHYTRRWVRHRGSSLGARRGARRRGTLTRGTSARMRRPGDHGVTMTVMGITATDCFLFNLSLCELYKFWLLASVARESEWALARKLALPLAKGRAVKQEKHFQAARARVKVNVRKKDTTLENMPIVCIGTRIPGNDKCHDSESSSWKWIKA